MKLKTIDPCKSKFVIDTLKPYEDRGLFGFLSVLKIILEIGIKMKIKQAIANHNINYHESLSILWWKGICDPESGHIRGQFNQPLYERVVARKIELGLIKL